MPIFEKMAAYDLPIWLHPTRSAQFADYVDEDRSWYDMWWAFGWPYETSVAMGRIVMSGLFDKHPDIKIITHHLGGMVPFFEGRVGPGLDQLGRRSDDPHEAGTLARLEKRPYEDLIEACILTGRPHQIRIHLSAIGAKLIGEALEKTEHFVHKGTGTVIQFGSGGITAFDKNKIEFYNITIRTLNHIP